MITADTTPKGWRVTVTIDLDTADVTARAGVTEGEVEAEVRRLADDVAADLARSLPTPHVTVTPRTENSPAGVGRVYVCGPITGHDLDERRAVFAAAAAHVRERGHDAVDPFDVAPPSDEKTWLDYMRADIIAMIGCDEVWVLPGWETSRGARVEARLANDLGIPIREGMFAGVEGVSS